jgi:hypothetical protein
MVVADGVISPDVFADNLLPFTRVASQLSIILAAVTPPVEQTLTSCDYARAAARHTVEANNAEGKSLSINDADIDLGVWKQNSATNNWEFESQSCTNSTNAVKVETRKDEAINGPVNLIFAQILGIESKELKAQSIAMLGWVKGIGLGKGAFPLALGDKNVPPPGGKLPVTFSSNNTDTGAWQTFSDPSASADSVTKLVNGTTPSPAIKCEDMIYVTNGVAASVLQEIYKEFYVVHGGDWTVILPVIGTESNYTGQKKVKGFCAFKITEVKQSPENSVSGYSLGGYIVPNAEPGGPDYGLKAGIAKLVR